MKATQITNNGRKDQDIVIYLHTEERNITIMQFTAT